MDAPFFIQLDDMSGEAIQALLREHRAGMLRQTPPESVHALSLEALRKPEITLWSAWLEGELCACGALKELDPRHGEVKSMRTHPRFLRRGAGRAVLDHIIQEARKRGYAQMSLETGSSEAFQPALALYRSAGFAPCGPFADYKADPFSVFMTLLL